MRYYSSFLRLYLKSLVLRPALVPLPFSCPLHYFLLILRALVLVAVFHLFGNIGRINSFRHGLDRKIIITFGIPSILLSLLGASPVGIISQDTFKVILGVFLILISVSFLGFVTGLVGTGGALRATFLTGFNLEKTKYVATAAVIALGTDPL